MHIIPQYRPAVITARLCGAALSSPHAPAPLSVSRSPVPVRRVWLRRSQRVLGGAVR